MKKNASAAASATSVATGEQPTVRQLAQWLISITRPVLRPLALSTFARIANQTLGIALYVIPVMALVHLALGERPLLWAVLGGMIIVALVKAFLRYLEHYLGHLVAFKALEANPNSRFPRYLSAGSGDCESHRI